MVGVFLFRGIEFLYPLLAGGNDFIGIAGAQLDALRARVKGIDVKADVLVSKGR